MRQDRRAGTPATATSNGVPHLGDVPVSCQCYGHSWESTARPGVKACSLCGVRGYCPGCTPLPSGGAKPFACSAHTGHRQVQP